MAKQAQLLSNQHQLLQQLVGAINHISLHPHPPSALVPSHSGSSPRTRNQGQQIRPSPSQPYAALGSVNGSSALDLVPSNANGKDTSGYEVKAQCDLASFVKNFFSKPLGSIKIHKETRKKELLWDFEGNWSQLCCRDKSYATSSNQKGEAKKIMELFVVLASEKEIEQMSAVLPLQPVALGVVLDAKRIATENVIVRLMHFLDEHEKLLPKTKTSTRASPVKSSNTGALYSRWKKLKYITTRPDIGGVKVIHPWANAGMALNGSAVATSSDSSSSIRNNKRSRIGEDS